MPGAAEVGNLAYMERLGLWGVGAAFPSFQAFLDSMKRRGITFLEMLSMELKGDGLYVSRGLSFRSVWACLGDMTYRWPAACCGAVPGSEVRGPWNRLLRCATPFAGTPGSRSLLHATAESCTLRELSHNNNAPH